MTHHRYLLFVVLALLLGARPAQAQVILTLQNATAQVSQGGFSINAAIDGSTTNGTGWAHNGQHTADDGVFETVADAIFLTYNFTLTMNFGGDHTLGRFRISTTTDDRATFADGLQNGGDVAANWIVLIPENPISSSGATMSVLVDNSILVGGVLSGSDVYSFSANSSSVPVTGFRIELLLDGSLPGAGPGRASNGNFVLTEFAVVGIPEPSTYALLACGLAVIGLAARRRK